MLNPAPARELPDELLALGPILTPNAGEAAELTGEQRPRGRRGARSPSARGAPVLVTLGARACSLLDGDRAERAARAAR